MLEALAATAFAQTLRTSFYLYPLVNAAHILALGALVTTALLMDARLLGFARHLPASTVIATLRPLTLTALVLAVATGFLLFSVRPLEYAANPAFRIKLVLLLFAVLNAGIVTAFGDNAEHPLIRVLAASSILLWLSVLVAGRFIGFFI